MNDRSEPGARRRFRTTRGIPSYDESRNDFVVAADQLAIQYAGYLAYAGIQQLRGRTDAADRFLTKAAELKRLVNTAWWDEKTQSFYARLNPAYVLEGRAGSALLYRDAAEDGPKMRSAVGDLLGEIKRNPSTSVELQSHHAEILYRYGEPEVAYAQMMDLGRPDRSRREYPEVSYSIVGAIATGTMGISIEPAGGAIRTLPALGPIAWVELSNVPIRGNEIAVRHEDASSTILTNRSGPALTWLASFPGSFQTLLVNDRPVRARIQKGSLGRVTCSARVTVGAGRSVRVQIPSSISGG